MKKSLSKPHSIAIKSAFKPLIKVTSTTKADAEASAFPFILISKYR